MVPAAWLNLSLLGAAVIAAPGVFGQFTSIFGNPYFWMLVAIYWLVSNAISSMDRPTATDSRAYRFWFKFLNGLNGNLARALKGKVPDVLLSQPDNGTSSPPTSPTV